MFWLFAAALTLTTALAILWPFWRARTGMAEPAAAYDLRVYRDQLAEIDRDLSRGIIEPADAERLRTEIGRKVLGADRALSRDAGAGAVTARHGLIAGAVLVVLIGAGGALYLRIGAPAQPDMALQTRIAAAEARYAGGAVERPAHWLGFRVAPTAIEFWQDRPHRLHERRLFTRAETGRGGEGWRSTLLYP